MDELAKIECVITAPGYRSAVGFPIGADCAEAFCVWFKMQLDYFGRWTPGSTASIYETTPLDAQPRRKRRVPAVSQDKAH